MGRYPTPRKTPTRRLQPGVRTAINALLATGATAAGNYIGSRVGQYARSMMSTSTSSSGAPKTLIQSNTAQADKTGIRLKRKNGKAYRTMRRFKKFKTKVTSAISRTGTTRVLNKTYNTTQLVGVADLNNNNGDGQPNGRIGLQRYVTLPILTYTANTTANSQFYDDLNEIMELVTNSSAGDTTQVLNPNVFIKSFLWEIMLKNVHPTNACYADIYYWRAKKTAIYDPLDFVPAAEAQVSDVVVSGGSNFKTTNVPDDYGWTPYQNRNIMKYIHIYKKERYYIQPGGCAQIEWRARVNRMYRKDQSQTGAASAASVTNKMIKGMSQGMFIVSYGTPLNETNQTITGPHTLIASYNKSIYYDLVKPGAPLGDTEARTYY